jgi:hypothetical protein
VDLSIVRSIFDSWKTAPCPLSIERVHGVGAHAVLVT